MQKEIITTADGSHSIYVSELNEHYHSINGAIQESEHVFIRAGLEAINPEISNLQVLELGFGTGLNAFLTYLHQRNNPTRHIYYTGIEAYPLETEMAMRLNYPEQLGEDKEAAVFHLLHSSVWGEAVSIASNFTITKITAPVQTLKLPCQYHLLYFDAFAPSVQPELWTTEVFTQMYEALLSQGILTTYCAKGVVKRTLKEVGFVVESISGPKGKREMTRAIKP